MSEGVIKDLEKSGKLRKQPAGVTQVEDLLREAARDLAEAVLAGYAIIGKYSRK